MPDCGIHIRASTRGPCPYCAAVHEAIAAGEFDPPKKRTKATDDNGEAARQKAKATRKKHRTKRQNQPCQECGQPKPPGSGRRFCDACRIKRAQAQR